MIEIASTVWGQSLLRCKLMDLNDVLSVKWWLSLTFKRATHSPSCRPVNSARRQCWPVILTTDFVKKAWHDSQHTEHNANLYFRQFLISRIFTGRQHSSTMQVLYYSHRRDVCLSVRPSDRLSHAGTEWKRRKLGSRNLHRQIAQRL